MAAEQTTSPAEAKTVPVGQPATARSGDEPTLPLADAVAPAGPTIVLPSSEPPPAAAAPSPVAPKPATWSGRVAVPGASGPGQKAAAPPEPTRKMVRYTEPEETMIERGPQRLAPAERPRVSRLGRFFTVLFALILLLAVPVVSAYVAYKLASGENPFDWPPTMDLSKVF